MSPKRIATRKFCCPLSLCCVRLSPSLMLRISSCSTVRSIPSQKLSHPSVQAPSSAHLLLRSIAPWQLDSNTTPTFRCLHRLSIASSDAFLRKEVIQPHLPIRLPCYDFTPVIRPAFGGSFLAVRSPTSGISDSHGVTGGVYKTRERIHRDMLIRDY